MSYFECEHSACGGEKEAVVSTYGECKVLCVLNGPFEPASRAEKHRGVVRVSVFGKTKRHEGIEEYMERMFTEIIQVRLYPRCVLDIRVYVLSHQRNLFSACINGISAVVMAAGIMCHGVGVGACSEKEGVLCTVGAVFKGREMQKILEVKETPLPEFEGDSSVCNGEIEDKLIDVLERMRYSLRINYEEAKVK